MSANTTAVIILQYTNVSNQCLAHLKLAHCHSQLYLNKTKRKKKKEKSNCVEAKRTQARTMSSLIAC